MDAKMKIVLEWANKVIASRPHICADETHENDAIGDDAAATLHNAESIVEHAIRTWQRRTAPPAVPRLTAIDTRTPAEILKAIETTGEAGPAIDTEDVTITRKPAAAPITTEDRREWLRAILQAVADASLARAQADGLALQALEAAP